MPAKGVKAPGHDSVATYDSSAEVNEEDYKEGQLRKAGQMSGDSDGSSSQ
ncbi:MAG TPA: hypothetical protein VFH78_03500 [Candidatus Thermoplasmatota archaeon]|nr:hypothetical protein [Candidatus Thermoplasmatota archaeon]